MGFGDYKASNLELNPELIDQTLSLIEDCFEYSKENSFKVDFYPLFNPNNFKNCHILVDENNQVVAHIGQKKRTLGSSFDSSLWGGIAVHKEFQGKGIFKNFFKSLLEKENEKTIQILWSGDPDLYTKLGFELKHQQFEYHQEDGNSEFQLIDKSTIDSLDLEMIKSLYHQKSENFLMFRRTDQDWSDWKQVTSADLYIQKKGEEIISYFLINKGQDLTNVIHEHFIPKELFSKVRSHGNIWTAAYEFPYEPSQISYLGLFKNDPGLKKLWINGIDSI